MHECTHQLHDPFQTPPYTYPLQLLKHAYLAFTHKVKPSFFFGEYAVPSLPFRRVDVVYERC